MAKMTNVNKELKMTIKNNELSQAIVAWKMGISPTYFSKMLQKPLKPEWKEKAIAAIKTLVEEDWENENESN